METATAQLIRNQRVNEVSAAVGWRRQVETSLFVSELAGVDCPEGIIVG
jgi:hypothetical protein